MVWKTTWSSIWIAHVWSGGLEASVLNWKWECSLYTIHMLSGCVVHVMWCILWTYLSIYIPPGQKNYIYAYLMQAIGNLMLKFEHVPYFANLSLAKPVYADWLFSTRIALMPGRSTRLQGFLSLRCLLTLHWMSVSRGMWKGCTREPEQAK